MGALSYLREYNPLILLALCGILTVFVIGGGAFALFEYETYTQYQTEEKHEGRLTAEVGQAQVRVAGNPSGSTIQQPLTLYPDYQGALFAGQPEASTSITTRDAGQFVFKNSTFDEGTVIQQRSLVVRPTYKSTRVQGSKATGVVSHRLSRVNVRSQAIQSSRQTALRGSDVNIVVYQPLSNSIRTTDTTANLELTVTDSDRITLDGSNPTIVMQTTLSERALEAIFSDGPLTNAVSSIQVSNTGEARITLTSSQEYTVTITYVDVALSKER